MCAGLRGSCFDAGGQVRGEVEHAGRGFDNRAKQTFAHAFHKPCGATEAANVTRLEKATGRSGRRTASAPFFRLFVGVRNNSSHALHNPRPKMLHACNAVGQYNNCQGAEISYRQIPDTSPSIASSA